MVRSRQGCQAPHARTGKIAYYLLAARRLHDGELNWKRGTWELLFLASQTHVLYGSPRLASADVTHNITYRSALPALSLPLHQMTAAEETVASRARLNTRCCCAGNSYVSPPHFTQEAKTLSTVLIIKLPMTKDIVSLRTKDFPVPSGDGLLLLSDAKV